MDPSRSNRFLDGLVSFVSALEYDDLPTAAVEVVERAFVDTLGVTIAGSQTDTVDRALTLATTPGGEGACASIVGHDAVASVTDAAFVNAIAGHALDFDDSHGSLALHPSVTMVAPLLAVAEARCDGGAAVSGRDLVTAYAAGFETQQLVADPLTPAHQQYGWHPTGTIGPFGAAAAVSRLLGLGPEQVRNALNVAASTPAGLQQNFGTMTKPMHAGQAARSGLTAALLAANGFEANPDALSADRGFVPTYNRGETLDPPTGPAPGDRWGLLDDGILFKKYPACGRTQTSIELAVSLARTNGLAVGDVAGVDVLASGSAADALPYASPRTGRESKFSMEYAVARGVAGGDLGLAAFEDAAVRDPAVRDLSERVTFIVDQTLPYDTREATVELTTVEGETVGDTLEYPPGHPENPMSTDEHREKYLSCARRGLDRDTALAVYDRLDDLRARPRVDDLLERLFGGN